jgi:hypothetical protein
MGRYYWGDIQGKFVFAVQASDAADRFGVTGERPQELNYYFTEDDLPAIEKGIKEIEYVLGEYLQKFIQWTNEVDFYNDKEASEYFNISEEEFRYLFSEFADWRLGVKIRDYVAEHGECQFTAET